MKISKPLATCSPLCVLLSSKDTTPIRTLGCERLTAFSNPLGSTLSLQDIINTAPLCMLSQNARCPELVDFDNLAAFVETAVRAYAMRQFHLTAVRAH